MSSKKETHFFSGRTWDRGLEWYRSQFDERASIRGEASTSYTKYPSIPDVPARIRTFVPDVKFVYLVRDPVERIVSHVHHNLISGIEESESVDAAVRSEFGGHYVDVSRYWLQLSQYLDVFEAEMVFVLTSEELRSDPKQVLMRLCSFLGADPTHRFVDSNVRKNVSAERVGVRASRFTRSIQRLERMGVVPPWMGKRLREPSPGPVLAMDTRLRLIERLRPEVQALERFMGRRLTEWRNFYGAGA